MNKLNMNVMALALGVAFSATAMAEGIPRDDYRAGKERVASQYKGEKAACSSFSGNAKDICVLEAKGREKVATAELDLAFKPGANSQYKLDLAKAETGFAVARERCDDKAGTVKDICVAEAKAGRTTAKADAKARMKVTDATVMAAAKAGDANRDARLKSTEARKDAADTANDAQYDVAKEKCDTYSGEAKEYCLNQAKKNFGKP